MKDRIRKYMDFKSISAGELSVALEVQRSNISHILNGRNKPGAAFIEKLLITYPDLNARWLLTGEGEMIEKGNTVVKSATIQPDDVYSSKETNKGTNEPMLRPSEVYHENKPIEKVVILYSDGTFSEFNRK